MERYAVSVCQKYLHAALGCEAVCRSGVNDVEAIHHMRVALRKVLSLFKVLADYVPAPLLNYERFLKTIVRALGDVRDLDVAYLSAPVDELATYLHKKREAAHARLIKIFTSKGYQRMLLSLTALLNDPQLIKTESESAKDVYWILVQDALKHFHHCTKRLHPTDKAKRFHRARIAGKELRYTLEFFRKFDKKLFDGLIDTMTELQDLMGAINDHHTAGKRLKKIAKKQGQLFSAMTLFAMGKAFSISKRREKKERGALLKALSGKYQHFLATI